jgi:hypothetical protein
LANPLGSIFGKLGWYNGRLNIRRVPALVGATYHDVGYDLEVFKRTRRPGFISNVIVHEKPMSVSLHPLFGWATS